MEGGKLQNEERTFFFFCFSLFKTTEICFGSTKMEIFYLEKAFHAGKKIRKMTLAPLKNIPLTPQGLPFLRAQRKTLTIPANLVLINV